MSTITTAPTQAQIFRAEHAKNAARNMLDVIEAIGERSKFITRIALGVSMPHQIGYILALAIPHMHWDTPSAILESLTMILLAVGVPVATDLLILNCIETIGAAAVARAWKWRAFWLMFMPAAASGTVNFLAPAPMLIKVLAAFIVALIPLSQVLRFINPDFGKIEEMETDIALGTPATKPGRVISRQELKARKRAGYDKMTAKEKAAWTRNYKPRGSKTETDHPVAQIQALSDEAPVSGIPTGA